MALIFRIWTGEPDFGLWCPRCLKPSGIRTPLYHVFEQGVSSMGEVRKCDDCGGAIADADD